MAPVFLLGGGWAPGSWHLTYGPFVQAATVAGRCQLAVLLVAGDGAAQWELEARYRSVFETLGVSGEQVKLFWLPAETAFHPDQLNAIQPTGILVGGGLTPHYQEALCGDRTWRDYLHQRQLPYAGFSAGAAIAAEQAIVGGWQVWRGQQELAILDAEFGEGLDEVNIRPGLGLVPFGVDVHASQWGTLTRLLQVVDLAWIREGWAIDENTALCIQEDNLQVYGLGQVYHVQRQTPGALLVRMYRAGDNIPVSLKL